MTSVFRKAFPGNARFASNHPIRRPGGNITARLSNAVLIDKVRAVISAGVILISMPKR
jgi:hypothetical protein